MKRIILKAGEEKRVKRGHPWVYANEVETVRAGSGAKTELIPGECADVESSPSGGRKSEYLGRAIVNPHSQIIARIYSPSKEGMDKGFFKRRIREALERRIAAGYDLSRDSCRIVFGEADFLPGLIVDRYAGADGASWLAVQFLAYGMDSRREMILEALEEISPCDGVIEKSAPVRELEGLGESGGVIRGTFPEQGSIIHENGLLFKINLLEGQKTGYFLDQRDNRRRTAKYAAALAEEAARNGETFRALDCFCYSGGFAVHTAAAARTGGITLVTAVDLSGAALALARENAALNGVEDAVETVRADAFDFLRSAERRREKYRLIILDPPAFAKNRAALENAMQGYREINLRAFSLLEKGGVLVTCSCSHAVDEGRFKAMIAAAASGRRIIQLDFCYQPPDHPVRVGYDESLYLKCGFYCNC